MKTDIVRRELAVGVGQDLWRHRFSLQFGMPILHKRGAGHLALSMVWELSHVRSRTTGGGVGKQRRRLAVEDPSEEGRRIIGRRADGCAVRPSSPDQGRRDELRVGHVEKSVPAPRTVTVTPPRARALDAPVGRVGQARRMTEFGRGSARSAGVTAGLSSLISMNGCSIQSGAASNSHPSRSTTAFSRLSREHSSRAIAPPSEYPTTPRRSRSSRPPNRPSTRSRPSGAVRGTASGLGDRHDLAMGVIGQVRPNAASDEKSASLAEVGPAAPSSAPAQAKSL